MENETFKVIISLVMVILAAGGLAWAGSQGSVLVNQIPLFALGIGLAFLIQWLVFIPAYIFKTEKFFDLTGSLTYIGVVLAAVLLSGNPGARALLLMGMVMVWALRLGSFLVTRIHRSGKDSRFDNIKTSLPRFLQTWTLQGLWVSFTLAAVLAAITSNVRVNLDGFALVGFLVWAFGLAFEALADRQKRIFRADPENKGRFIQSGLWSWSRHPNYFGEIVLWVGAAIIALPVLRGWQWVTLISPVFVFLLLTRVSGIPLLEKRADEKWGGQADYEAYKTRTPVLVPRPPRDQADSS